MDAGQRLKRLKGAQKLLISACGGIENAASVCSYSTSTVGRWNELNAPNLMPMDVVVALEEFCGRVPVTQAMAEMNGRRVVSPEGEVAESQKLLTLLSDLGVAHSDISKLSMAAISDGTVDINEANSLAEPVEELFQVLTRLRDVIAEVNANGAIQVVPK